MTDETVSDAPGVFTSFFGPDALGLLSVVILSVLGTWGLPQMVQKFYAIKDERSIHKGTIISTLFALVVAGGCYFLGGFGEAFLTGEQVAAGGYDGIIPSMMERVTRPSAGAGCSAGALRPMSTLSSLVLASSSTLTIDLIDPKRRKWRTKRRVLLMRVFVVAFVAISAVIAIWQYKNGAAFIAQLMGISWGALAGGVPSDPTSTACTGSAPQRLRFG